MNEYYIFTWNFVNSIAVQLGLEGGDDQLLKTGFQLERLKYAIVFIGIEQKPLHTFRQSIYSVISERNFYHPRVFQNLLV